MQLHVLPDVSHLENNVFITIVINNLNMIPNFLEKEKGAKKANQRLLFKLK